MGKRVSRQGLVLEVPYNELACVERIRGLRVWRLEHEAEAVGGRVSGGRAGVAPMSFSGACNTSFKHRLL